MPELMLGILWYANLLLALTLHEAAHAWAALLGGDQTAYSMGQVTLDPRPHIQREPFGTILFPILSYAFNGWMMGWASAPYDPLWARDYPRKAAWMAVAGPAANLLLAVIAGVVMRAGLQMGFFILPEEKTLVQIVEGSGGIAVSLAPMLSIMFSLNLLLFVFNLIPLPPLDGSSVITLLMSKERARWFQEVMSQPFLNILGLIVAWNICGAFMGPAFRIALRFFGI